MAIARSTHCRPLQAWQINVNKIAALRLRRNVVSSMEGRPESDLLGTVILVGRDNVATGL